MNERINKFVSHEIKNIWIPEFVKKNFPFLPLGEKISSGDVSLLETEWIIENNLLRPEAGKLVSKVVESSEFCEIIARLCETEKLSVLSMQKFRSAVAGCIFELASFHFVRNKLVYFFKEAWDGGGDLLSPDETFLLYSVMFPSRQVDRLDLLFTGMSGVTVPDGIILAKYGGKTQIKGVVEYSASRDFWSRKEAITHRFVNDFFPTGPERGIMTTAIGRSINAILPQFPPKLSGNRRDFKVIYVVPDDEAYPVNGNGRTQTLQTPFSRSELRLVVDGIMQDVARSVK